MRPHRIIDRIKKQKEPRYLDLHTHTTVSDGMLTPEELVRQAFHLKFKVIGLTDHDTLNGVNRARAEAEKYGIEIIPGCELTAYSHNIEIHILAYFIEPDNRTFREYLEKFIRARFERAREMVRKLNKVKVRINFNKLVEKYQSESLGRPHIAREIVAHGYETEVQAAFKKYLLPGMPAYVPKFLIHPRELIRLILQSGGVPVFAHPYYYFNYEAIVKKMMEYGLRGLEVFHTYHSRPFTRKFMATARKFGLIMTGGSDAHSGMDGKYLPFGKVALSRNLARPLRQERDRVKKYII
ncbi:MAG: PHP domain-containing protein [bacterium]|nr:PHP domain-containing protein [bacterium]